MLGSWGHSRIKRTFLQFKIMPYDFLNAEFTSYISSLTGGPIRVTCALLACGPCAFSFRWSERNSGRAGDIPSPLPRSPRGSRFCCPWICGVAGTTQSILNSTCERVWSQHARVCACSSSTRALRFVFRQATRRWTGASLEVTWCRRDGASLKISCFSSSQVARPFADLAWLVVHLFCPFCFRLSPQCSPR